jgi:hypothetical protein
VIPTYTIIPEFYDNFKSIRSGCFHLTHPVQLPRVQKYSYTRKDAPGTNFSYVYVVTVRTMYVLIKYSLIILRAQTAILFFMSRYWYGFSRSVLIPLIVSHPTQLED